MARKNKQQHVHIPSVPPVGLLGTRVTHWIGTPASVTLHTLFFVGSFSLLLFGYTIDSVLLILTTVVSLEAIYLSIFIQMTINRQAESLRAVEEDIDEIQEDVDEIQEDVQGIEGNVLDISKDIDEIQADDDKQESQVVRATKLISRMQSQMQEIMQELQTLKTTEEQIKSSFSTKK